ncbi:DUF6526 family protein [Pedobacter sandarakinus]|uniref:DUF6526 family protein n=1 Tax=Pedobacter sandarakinus TaxID=353156 RepID=UPI002246D773|nr:DUF6526 family protein [Pedobacter sandarakinus]MCX2574227.1 DUF6526 family protein [Pedobacter sandarakinus]
MAQQYNNHKRFYPLFHFFTIPLTFIGLCFAIYGCVNNPNLLSTLVVLAFFLILMVALISRMSALKAQDRAARAEEKLRYFILTGKPLPNELKLGQILALRFASDEEFIDLTERTLNENLSPDEIKKNIKKWRGDYHRI